MTQPLPDYKNLDLSGEALQTAMRMEARAQAPASQAMFAALVAPLLADPVRTVCEFGCGTAALSRKIARAAPHAMIYASDKSEGMLQAARQMIDHEQIPNVQLYPWDILDASAFPFPVQQFDLIISSVVIPYFEDAQAIPLIARLASHLAPGGILAFMEQDWMTDSVHYPQIELVWEILGKEQRTYKRSLGIGLRPILRDAGLQLLPQQSFLWTDTVYGPYTREMLERFADAASDQGRIQPHERDQWKQALIDLASSGDFFYGIVYHLIAGKRL